MSKPTSVATQKPSSNMSARANGLPSQLQQATASPSRSPSATTPVSNTPTHSRKSGVLSPAVSVKDGVSVPSSSSHRSSGIRFGAIDVDGSSGPSTAASAATAAPPVVNGFARTSSAAPPKRKLDAYKLFQVPTSFAPRPNPSVATPTNPTTPPSTTAAGQPLGPLTGTVPQVGSSRLGHQPPVMQHQQPPPPPGPVPAPGQMPGHVPSTLAPGRSAITTSLRPSAREFVPGGLSGLSPMIPSPGFPSPKKSNAIKICNPNTGEAVVLRPPDVGHSRNLSRDTPTVHESSQLRKVQIRMESQQAKRAREEKERKAKEKSQAKKRKEAEDKAKKEEEEREAKRKAQAAERLKQEEEERREKKAEEKAKREEKERIRLEEKKRQEEEEAREKKEEEERIKEQEERERKEKEEHERKEKEELERKEREEAEAKARAEAEEKIRKDAEEAARLAAEAKAKEEAEAKEREEREKENLQAPSLSRTASASSVATPASASLKPGSTSLPPKPILPPIATGGDRPRMQRHVPGPLGLSSTQKRAPLPPGFPSALASARKIEDLDSVTYPEGIKIPSVELNQGQTKGGKHKYDRDFLLQFMQICKDKPENLRSLDALGIERAAGGDDNSGSSHGSTGRNQGRRMTSMNPPGPNRSASLSMGLGLNFPGGKNAPTPFSSMGNFSSTPLRMTSEERFAASNKKDRAVRGGSKLIRDTPMSGPSSQGGGVGVGGPNAVPSRPKAVRTRSQRGRARNDLLKPKPSQPSQLLQQQQQALPGPLDLPSTQQPAPLLPDLPSALASARKVDDLDSSTYPEGIKTPSVKLN